MPAMVTQPVEENTSQEVCQASAGKKTYSSEIAHSKYPFVCTLKVPFRLHLKRLEEYQTFVKKPSKGYELAAKFAVE